MRVRLNNGKYRQAQLAKVAAFHEDGVGYEEALRLAEQWFESPNIKSISAASYERGINTKLYYNKTVDGFTVGDAVFDYIEWKRVAASQNYLFSSVSLANHHIIPRIGDIPVKDFTARDFTKFCMDILETAPKYGKQKLGPRRPLSTLDQEALRKRKGSLNSVIALLRGAFKMAWENGEIESSRAWHILKRVPNAEVPRHYFLTRIQAQRLIAACRPDLAKLVTGALYSGCRVSELANLRVRDVGCHFFGIYVEPQKSYTGRYVYLPDEGMSFFLDQCEGKDEESHVFHMASGGHWIGHHKHIFKDAVRKAGLPERFVFHGLRHTYASQLVQAGTPLAIVASQLGHSNTDTVSRTYGHLSCQTIEEELARRFAPLIGAREDDRLDKIRQSLQQPEPMQRSWPRSNFGSGGGEIVSLLRTAEERFAKREADSD